MTIIIATDIRNTNETFIGIFMSIPLGYIVIIIMGITNTWWKMSKKYHDNQRYRMHTISMSVDGEDSEIKLGQKVHLQCTLLQCKNCITFLPQKNARRFLSCLIVRSKNAKKV